MVRSLWREIGEEGSKRSPLLLPCVVWLLVVWPLAALAQTPGDPSDQSKNGGVYRRPLGNDPITLDPARVADSYGLSVVRQIFDGLVQFDQTLTVAPALAQFWRASRDGLTWTFNLRKDVRFHHGREMTADDVVYSLTRILDPKNRSGASDLFLVIRGAREFRAGRAKRVSGLVALDRHTVEVTLTEALTPFVSLLAVGHAKIVPRELAAQEGDAFGTHPVGTGPFKFVRWDRGREIVLAAHGEHFAGPPKLARVVYRIFPGEQFDAMYDEFAKGHLEDTALPLRDYKRIVASRAQSYFKRPLISVRFYGINTHLKPLDDPRVRQALAHAIDREVLVEEAFLGRYVVARGILPPGTQGFNPKLAAYAFDPRKARELLKQAGYADGRGLPPISIWSSVKHEGIVREHEEIRRQLEAVGIQAEFHYLTDWPAFSRALTEGRLPVFLYAWFADVPDPDNFLFKLFHSKSVRNFFAYANPVVDGLLVTARETRDPQRRVDLYRRAEELILDDSPIIPIFHYTYERLFQPYVRSIEVNGLGDPYIPLRKIWLDRGR